MLMDGAKYQKCTFSTDLRGQVQGQEGDVEVNQTMGTLADCSRLVPNGDEIEQTSFLKVNFIINKDHNSTPFSGTLVLW